MNKPAPTRWEFHTVALPRVTTRSEASLGFLWLLAFLTDHLTATAIKDWLYTLPQPLFSSKKKKVKYLLLSLSPSILPFTAPTGVSALLRPEIPPNSQPQPSNMQGLLLSTSQKATCYIQPTPQHYFRIPTY